MGTLCSVGGVWAQTCDFVANALKGCAPYTINFSDQSSPAPVSYKWDFGDGNTSTQKDPSNVYFKSGVYTVTLEATFPNNQVVKTTKTAYISIFDKPSADFINSTATGCQPWPVSFTNKTTLGSGPITDYFWDFGNTFSDTNRNTSYVYQTPGTFSVKLIVTDSNGCQSIKEKKALITVIPIPVADFASGSQVGCSYPHSVSFVNTTDPKATGAVSYEWDFGDGGTSTTKTPSHVYQSAGGFDVRLIVVNSNGCRDTITKKSFINVEIAKANFSSNPNVGCPPLFVNFGNSSLPNLVGNQYEWSFGSIARSSAKDTGVLFRNSGNYSVKLVVTTPNGCKDSITKTNLVQVSPGPSAAFYADDSTACSAPHDVKFTSTTTVGSSWEWQFGDGTTSTARNPQKHYPDTGKFTVRLKVTGSNGCIDTVRASDMIKIGPPRADFTPSVLSGCAPLTVGFSNNTISYAPLASVSYRFGDGTYSNQSFPNHTYNDTGLFLPYIRVKTDDGCVDSAFYDTIGVGMQPAANFTVDHTTGCRNQLKVHFKSLTNQGNVKADYFEWFPGTGLRIKGKEEADFTYTSNSAYYDVLLVAYHHGCPDSMVKKNLINVLDPTSHLTAISGGCNGDSLFFENRSIGGQYFQWIFGDGDTIKTDLRDNVSHVYAPGDFTANLITNDTLTGCWDTSSYSFVVASSDILKWRSDTAVCTRQTTWFFDQTPGSEGWYWTIGEVLACTTRNCQYYPPKPGWYDVIYSAIYKGCRYTNVKKNYLHVYGPGFDFLTPDDPICAPKLVNMVTHVGGERPIKNASVSVYKNLSFIESIKITSDTIPYYFSEASYPQDSGYFFRYSAIDTAGCSNYAEDRMLVYRPKGEFIHERRATCLGDKQYFEASILDTTSPKPLQFRWEFGDGTVETYDSNSVFHSYMHDSIYAMKLIIIDSIGCADTLRNDLNIDVRNLKADFRASDTFKLCPPMVVSFYDSSKSSYNGIIDWEWSLGDGAKGNARQPVKAYLEPGKYDISLKITDSLGCVDSIIKPAYIHIQGTKITYSIDVLSGCEPLTLKINSLALGNAEINWNMRDGSNIKDSTDFTYVYKTHGSYVPSAFVKDQSGCQYIVASKDTIKVFPRPVAAFSVIPGCKGDSSKTLNLTEEYGDTVNYTWYFTKQDSVKERAPHYKYPNEGDYPVLLFATSVKGCMDSVSDIAIVSDPTGKVKLASPRSCAMDSIQIELVNLGVGQVTQVNWDFDDGNSLSVSDSVIKHVYLNKGVYQPHLNFVNQYGCKGYVLPGDSLVVGDNFAPVVSEIFRTSVDDDNRTSTWFQSNNSVDFEKYIVQRMGASGRFNSIAEITNSQDTIFLDAVPTLHQSYRYRVLTKNFCGYYTDTSALTPHRTIELTAAPANNSSHLTWNAYEGWQPDGYEIWRLKPGIGFEKLMEVSGNQLYAFDSAITCNQGYYYKIKATGSGKYQESFSDSSGTIPHYIPYVAPNELYAASIEGNNKNLIQWSYSKGGKEKVAYYILERSKDGINYHETKRFDEYSNNGYDRVDSASLRNYYYRTIVQDSCGYQSEPSNYGRTMILKAEIDTNDRPKLTWDQYEYWEEGVDFYDIEIYDKGQFVYLATTDGFTTSYTDMITDVNQRADYCYRITARSTLDGGKTSHSSIACAPVHSRIYVPNAFRPVGGLKENSHFYPKGMYISDFYMAIYDRWGQMLFETHNMDEGWDGTVGGEPAPQGVYIYYIEYKGVDKDFESLSGNLTLIR